MLRSTVYMSSINVMYWYVNDLKLYNDNNDKITVGSITGLPRHGPLSLR